LAIFVTRQRSYGEARMRHMNATLDGHSRIDLLEGLEGWTWSKNNKWVTMYLHTEQFVRTHKKFPRYIQKASTLTPAEEEEKKLGRWLNAQRIPTSRQRLESTSATVRGARDTRSGHITALLALCDASLG